MAATWYKLEKAAIAAELGLLLLLAVLCLNLPMRHWLWLWGLRATSPWTLRSGRGISEMASNAARLLDRIVLFTGLKRPCLPASLAYSNYMSRRGHLSIIVLGVHINDDDGTLAAKRAHAWVSVSGEIVLGMPESVGCREVAFLIPSNLSANIA